MKNILIILLFPYLTQGQNLIRKYAEKLNSDASIDSFYVKIPGDSVFKYTDNSFVSRTIEYYNQFFNPTIPNGFSNFTKCADGVYKNYLPSAQTGQAVTWANVSGKPSAVTNLSNTNTGDNATNSQYSGLAASKENTIPSGTSVQYFRGDKTFQTLDKTSVGLPNVDNTSDASKPVSTATQTALDLKLATNGNGSSLTGLTKTQVGLANVDNTSDANKPVSAAQQTALNLKQDISTNNGGWTTLRVAGSNATTTGQSLTPITGLVTPTLSNATLYEIDAVLYVSTSNVTTGTQYAITANGTGGAAQVFMNISGTTTTNATTTVTQSASGTAAGTFLTTSSSSGIIIIRGFVLTRGSGTATIELDHLKVTSGTSTVLIGSALRYRLAQ